MRKIRIWRDPHDRGFEICEKTKITLKEGVTILVGCNGIGKSTLLRNIKAELEEKDIPVVMFDNLADGGKEAMSEVSFNEDYTLLSQMIISSEGENINTNLAILCSRLKPFVETGRFSKCGRMDKMIDSIFRDKIEEKVKKLSASKERWILLDAIDSRYSIDNVVELKEFFDMIVEDCKSQGKELYVVASANAYELARNSQCFDVWSGEYVTFNDYEEYRDFVLKTRKIKDKRFEN